jgi:hypothetical protein
MIIIIIVVQKNEDLPDRKIPLRLHPCLILLHSEKAPYFAQQKTGCENERRDQAVPAKVCLVDGFSCFCENSFTSPSPIRKSPPFPSNSPVGNPILDDIDNHCQ